MKHNHDFTSAVVNDIIQKHGLLLILRFKSDNCSMQYKFIWVFRFWSNLAKKLNTKIIIYYGVWDHGKGLVDAMRAFGVNLHSQGQLSLRIFNIAVLKISMNIWTIILEMMNLNCVLSYHHKKLANLQLMIQPYLSPTAWSYILFMCLLYWRWIDILFDRERENCRSCWWSQW